MNSLYFNNQAERLLTDLTDGLYNQRKMFAASGLPFVLFNKKLPLFGKVLETLKEVYVLKKGKLVRQDILNVMHTHKVDKNFGYNKVVDGLGEDVSKKVFAKFNEDALHWDVFFEQLSRINQIGANPLPFEQFDEKKFVDIMLPLYEQHFGREPMTTSGNENKRIPLPVFNRNTENFKKAFADFKEACQQHSELSASELVLLSLDTRIIYNNPKFDKDRNFNLDKFDALDEGWTRFKIYALPQHVNQVDKPKKARKILGM